MWGGRMASGSGSWLPRLATLCGGGAVGVASMFIAKRDERPSSGELAAVQVNTSHWTVTGPIKRVNENLMIARRVTTNFDGTGLKLRLYQYEACPFCCKVRAYLDYFGFSYDTVEVRPLTRKEIKKLDGVSKLPTVVTGDDRKLSDSSLIISTLASYLTLKDKSLDDVIAMYPEERFFVHSTGKEMVAHPNLYQVMGVAASGNQSAAQLELAENEMKWRKWVDEHFIKLIVPNIYHTWSECLQMFRWFSDAGQWEKLVPSWERFASVYFGATAMYFLSKKIRKGYDGDVRMLIIRACDEWISAIGDAPFLGGKSPNLADLAMYGALNSFKGSKTFLEIFANSDIETWYDRMHKLVEAKAGSSLIVKRSSAKK